MSGPLPVASYELTRKPSMGRSTIKTLTDLSETLQLDPAKESNC
jgi:hypothetical protein